LGRRLTSLGLLLLTAAACASPFGRFGYAEEARLPGIIVDKAGFRADHPAAETFRFESESKLWNPVSTTDIQQIVNLSGVGRAPNKLRLDLAGVGFSAHFNYGFRFHLRSTGAPFLTWHEASVAPGTPTPEASWVVISFRDNQPPILISFPGKPCAVELVGKIGDWQVRSVGPYQGWVRILAPLGNRPFPTVNAGDLGRLAAQVKTEERLWTQPAPQLTGMKLEEDLTSVTATWTFDRPGALVPPPVFLAALGGYQVRLQSKTRRLGIVTEEGPVEVTEGPELKVRFVVRRIPAGRGLGVGEPTVEPIATASPLDVPSVVELALANLQATRDHQVTRAAESTLTEYLNLAEYQEEPLTGLLLPYQPTGEGLDLAAAHALLLQTTISTSRPSSDENALLTSLVWRRDWYTWSFLCRDSVSARRAAALAAVVGALCPEPERRLDAAMLQAGIAAQRGLEIWRRRNNLPVRQESWIEPLEDLRWEIFNLQPERPLSGFGRLLMSDLRLYGEESGTLIEREGKLYLQWEAMNVAPVTLTLASGFPIQAQAGQNLTGLDVAQALGFVQLRATPTQAGICEIELTMPEWVAALPRWLPAPRYSEESRLSNPR
jgi:hypothetical protein